MSESLYAKCLELAQRSNDPVARLLVKRHRNISKKSLCAAYVNRKREIHEKLSADLFAWGSQQGVQS